MKEGSNLGAMVPGSGTGASPYREHWLGLPPTSNDDSLLSRSYIVLTSAQILALNTTPITLIPAPVTNAAIIVHHANAKITYKTATYTGSNALQLQYTDGSGAVAASFASSALLDKAATTVATTPGLACNPVLAAALVASVPSANPAVGDSTIAIEVIYEIRKLNM